jgi:hydroxyacylglutathione hydrolase
MISEPLRAADHARSLQGLTTRMKCLLCASLAAALSLACSAAASELAPGSMEVHWNEGAPDCATSLQPPIQVHAYNAETFILRENPCASAEANFMYLLIGTSKALLIDTGDVADPKSMPLARTVMNLLPRKGASPLPLIVAHTHRHQDHRAGDPQFTHLPNVQVVGYDLRSVQLYFGFANWPGGVTQVDLGDRTVDVIPTPGHEETHVSFYDRRTGLFFSGDFLMPGRLTVDDAAADLMSAKRVANFVMTHPVSYVLGGHIELSRVGEPFPSGSQFHPGERPLQMSKDDLLALPTALGSFNGFYARHGNFIFINPMHNLIALVVAALIVLVCLAAWLLRYLRGRQAARRPTESIR